MSTENEPDIETHDTDPPPPRMLAEDTVPSSMPPDGVPLPAMCVIPASVLEYIIGQLRSIDGRLANLEVLASDEPPPWAKAFFDELKLLRSENTELKARLDDHERRICALEGKRQKSPPFDVIPGKVA